MGESLQGLSLFVSGQANMIKRTAVLIDGGLLREKIKQSCYDDLRRRKLPLARPDGSMKRMHDMITARDYANRVVTFAHACLDLKQEELYRIFYYDSPLYDGGPSRIHPHPMGATARITESDAVGHQKQLLGFLRTEEFVAVRLGEMSFDGWVPSRSSLTGAIATGRAFLPTDFIPMLRQKGVDLRIGVDMVLLAKDKIIDRIILVTSDSDLVPAMKLARREGVQVVLIHLGSFVKHLLREHADIYRKATC